MVAGAVRVDRNSHIRKGTTMGEQQSQKHGLRSSAQKEERAREDYAPIPPSNPVAGAFGQGAPEGPEGEPSFANDDDVKAANARRSE